MGKRDKINRVNERHLVQQWLLGYQVDAIVFQNFCDRSVRLLLDGPIDEPGVARRALIVVDVKDDDGIAWQAPMSIGPLKSYPLPLQVGASVSVVIGKILYKMTWVETVEPWQLRQQWGETVAERARKDVPCPCFTVELEDDKEDYGASVAEMRRRLRWMLDGKNPFEDDQDSPQCGEEEPK